MIRESLKFIVFVVFTAIATNQIFGAIDAYPIGIKEIIIPSSADDNQQMALFYSSKSPDPKPLLVALHTWGSHYDQAGPEIPYAQWCIDHDWVFVHPEFRGPNTNPEALGSDLVVSDILDAVQYARENARIDSKRIYLVGVSGGAHAALIMAARHPDIWSAVSAWCPIYDVKQWWIEKTLAFFTANTLINHLDWNQIWYEKAQGNSQYIIQIEAACTGKPGTSPEIDQEYFIRSPMAWLNPNLDLPIQIAAGIHDGRTGSVPFTHSLHAFNAIADSEDQLTHQDIDLFYETLSAKHLDFTTYFDTAYNCHIHFIRTSGNTRVIIYAGSHEIHHSAALTWLSKQRKGHNATWISKTS